MIRKFSLLVAPPDITTSSSSVSSASASASPPPVAVVSVYPLSGFSVPIETPHPDGDDVMSSSAPIASDELQRKYDAFVDFRV